MGILKNFENGQIVRSSHFQKKKLCPAPFWTQIVWHLN